MKLEDGFEIAELAELKEIDVVAQQVIVNGVPQNVMAKGYAIVCPKCGRVLYQFSRGISQIDAFKAMNEGREELLKIATYCPTCGTKLFYGGEIIELPIEKGEQEEN